MCINKKKIQINAQVTAMTALLELFFNVTATIIAGITKVNSFEGIIMVYINYFILLPYVFLMNTSHNKTRIIEYGWKNLLKNTMGKSNNNLETNHDNQVNTCSKSQTSNKKTNIKNNCAKNQLHADTNYRSTAKRKPRFTNSINNLQMKNQGSRNPRTSYAQIRVIDLEQQDEQPELNQNAIHEMIRNVKNDEKFQNNFNKCYEDKNVFRNAEIINALELESDILFCK